LNSPYALSYEPAVEITNNGIRQAFMRLFGKAGLLLLFACLIVQALACSLNTPCPDIGDEANGDMSPDSGRITEEQVSGDDGSDNLSTSSMMATRRTEKVSDVLDTNGEAAGDGAANSGDAESNGKVTTGNSGAAGKRSAGTSGKGGAKATGKAGRGGSGGSGGKGENTAASLDKFSFFVTSLATLQQLSKNQNGFGGDLRFGETGAGAGLRGADKICSTIAEKSMSGASSKVWRAFLSATADEKGAQVNAIDRIGEGPWYDRLGRVFAMTKTDLLATRPAGADPAIANDFPNEDGVPNHQPDPSQAVVDNHDMLTGTNAQGQLYSATSTCMDWTASDGAATNGKPRVGHSWPRYGAIGAAILQGDGMGNWMSSLDESGCAPGVYVMERGAPQIFENNVGSGGGYGGFYCFALKP
jgi:hypothetical protein